MSASGPWRSRQIIVAGGGIAGLTAALAFAGHGLPVRLYERSPTFQEVGAGLQLSPNATRILARLGVLESIEPAAVRPSALVMRRASTLAEIGRMPLGDVAQSRWGAPYLVLHRADLHGALAARAKRAPDIEIVTGATVRDVAFHAHGVTASIDRDGRIEEVGGDVLVAADGVWSSLRQLAGSAGLDRHSGRIAWRTTVRADGPAFGALMGAIERDVVTAIMHRSTHMVVYPIRAGAAVNLVAITPGPVIAESWTNPAEAAELRKALAGADPRLEKLVLDAAPWTRWPLHTVPPDAPWINPAGLVLIGDAAHAMTPFAAQGAAAAIEDAYVLARTIADSAGEIGPALARYESIRRPRVRRVARRGAFNEFTWHARGPIAIGRDAILALRGGEKLLSDFDWLYGWDPDEALSTTG